LTRQSFGVVREHFNAAAEGTRVLVILSPT